MVGEYLKDRNVLAAPDDPNSFIRKHLDPFNNRTNNTSYIMNGGLDPSGEDSAGATSRPLILSAIEQPSKTILLGVIFNDGNFYLDVKNGDQSLINPNLFGTSNDYVFMDGSARTIEGNEYQELNAKNGSDAYLWLIHKGDP